MGLILCAPNKVRNPYYISSVGVHIESIEELSYFIFKYPLFSLDMVSDEKLFTYIRDELCPGLKGLQLYRRFLDGMSDTEALISILGLCDYYSNYEIDRFKSILSEYRLLPKYKLIKEKGDIMYHIGRYGQAIRYYANAAEEAGYMKAPSTVYADIYRNIAISYSNLFDFDNAFDFFVNSYKYHKNEEILKYIYYISREQPVKEKKEKYLAFIGDRVNKEWEKEYNSLFLKAKDSESVDSLNVILAADSVKKNKQISGKIFEWKQEYRKML